ncbi:MAG: S8 family serine peptidase, partial [Pseudomonadota bacterium]|nr:S8 family serine peptidase [Pseudomonadota bacterium]
QLSVPHPQHPGKLNFAWKILFPNEQIPQGPFSYDTNFDVQLSELGVYSIGLVAQDSRGVCALSVVEVGVTDNPQLVRNANPNLLPLSKLDGDFGHVRALNAEKAWTISQGKGQKIAIIDTGVNYNHPYLSSNIAINDKELPGNNIDDDRNGLIDDVFGWDFVQEDALPYDDSGHGSHVAGLAAGKVFGIAQDAKILAIKGVMVDGITDLGLVISGIYYAADNGATVINLSLGGPASKDPQKDLIPLRKAFAYAESKGAVIVTASGNGARSANGSTVPINIDISLHLPAGLDILNNISVAATNAFGQLTSYSNFGIKSVKVAAPGGDDSKPVFSAKQDNSKGNLFFGASGTSMATPIVSGAIALARAANSEMSMKELNEILQKSGTTNPSLRGKVKSERILDVFALVNNAQNRLF